MQPTENNKAEVKVFPLRGRLDANTSAGIEEQLLQNITQGGLRMVLDFTELTFVSSHGLRVLLAVAKQIHKADGKLALFGLNHSITEIFKIAGFMNLFSIYATRDEAVAHCVE
jgi:anti-anti-sigma factor